MGASMCAGSLCGTFVASAPHEMVYGRHDRVIRCPWHGWEFDREAVSVPRNMLYVNPAGVLRDDARAPDGSAPGADPAHTARQLLDANGVSRAVLSAGRCWASAPCPTRTWRR